MKRRTGSLQIKKKGNEVNTPTFVSMHESVQKNHNIGFSLKQESSILHTAHITIPQEIVLALYTQASKSQMAAVQLPGFNKGNVPLEYITENFRSNLVEHVKEFLYRYFAVEHLLQEISNNKLLVAGKPRLTEIYVDIQNDARFTFQLSIIPPIPIQDWKYLPFKAPKRKNYKDLDRQVESFIEDERAFLKDTPLAFAQIGDWVSFDITLLDEAHKPLCGTHSSHLWLKLGDEEADTMFHEIFIGKNVGDSFVSANRGLQEYFSTRIETKYPFLITINDVLKGNYFCLEYFKRHFKLKTNKELYQKLIEVFSYRNDLSLRRSMAEESLKLLLSKNRFTTPNHVVLRQQQIILDIVKTNPDYHVYRMQKDFQERVRQLAEKQIRETLLIDQLAYHEEIEATDADIKSYLNLTNRPRMKDFIYFDSPITKISGQEIPFSSDELKRFSLREKTLNHIIYHLMKK